MGGRGQAGIVGDSEGIRGRSTRLVPPRYREFVARMGGWVLALTMAFGCGRLGFDPIAGDTGLLDSSIDASGDGGAMDAAMDGAPDTAMMMDSSIADGSSDTSVVTDTTTPPPPLAVNLTTCAAEAVFGGAYSCMPSVRDPIAGEVIRFSLSATNTCAWAGIDPTSGAVSGSVLMDGFCDLGVFAQSSLGPSADGSLRIGVAVGSDVRQMDIGAWHTCALSAGGAVRCWGLNSVGQLGYDDTAHVGDGTAGRSIADMGDVNVGGLVRQISLAYMQSCALMATGGVRCWGGGSFGRLGYGHTNDVGAGGPGGTITDNGDLPLGGEAVQVITGGVGGCARMLGGGVRCWGHNHGNGADPEIIGLEIAAAGDLTIGFEVADVVGGYNHYCALSTLGAVRCWGQNWAGALGYDDTLTVGDGTTGRGIAEMGDVNVGGRVVQLSAGDQTTCAVLDSGALRCWGANDLGQLGYGDTTNVGDGTAGRSIVEMGDVPVGGTVSQAWAGEQHTCAIMTTGAVRCWGFNSEGQLGYDDTLSVGDGTAGRAIVDMGDVPLAGTARHVVTTDWDTGFTCALMTSGGLRCWGNNGGGQLGLDDSLNVGDGTAGRAILDFAEVQPFVP